MPKYKIEATGTIGLEFTVEAEDELDAETRADAMAKDIKMSMRGELIVPPGVSMTWTGTDGIDWDETREI